jgi:hypothetical protein
VCSDDSFFLRGFRAPGLPALPALPASLLDGKEGVDGSSPSEGLKYLQIDSFCCLVRRDVREEYGGGQVRLHLQELLSRRGPLGQG